MKVKVWLLLVALVTVLVAGCSPTQVPPAQAPEPPAATHVLEPLSPAVTVTVGAKEVVSDSGLLIGVAKGYYQELGLNIESVNFNTGQEMI
ncbi:MAG: metal ABC transporter substrate-binding protein, partial [bacterium]